MEDYEVVSRQELYDKVWAAIQALAVDAAPGSITPETFSRISVDIVMSELRRAGAINAVYRKP